jgi:Domain of unknown function (DUF1902)
MGSSVAKFVEWHLLRVVAHLRKIHVVCASWDDEARVWYVRDSSVPGLSLEAESPDLLLKKLEAAVPELLVLNSKRSAIVAEGRKPLRMVFEECLGSP